MDEIPTLANILQKMMKDEAEQAESQCNEDKTGLILMGSRAARRKLLEGGVNRTLNLAGEEIGTTPKAKLLGLILSEDMNWTDEVEAKFGNKLRSLMRLRCVASQTMFAKHCPKEVVSRGSRAEQDASTSGGD